MSDVPKLYPNKPKKAHLKQSRKEHQASSSSSTMSSSTAPGNSGGAPPPQLPKESFARRYKFMWPLLLAVNFTAGAYLFMRTRKSGEDAKGEDPSFPSASVSTTVPAAIDTEEPSAPRPIVEPPKPPSIPPPTVEPPKPPSIPPPTVGPPKPPSIPPPTVGPPKPREPIPVDQLKELFKWMLEEKRKIKVKDAEEKKLIDEEKALLKQFIRTKSVPDL